MSKKKHREFEIAASVVVKDDDECTVRVQKILDEETPETLLYCVESTCRVHAWLGGFVYSTT